MSLQLITGSSGSGKSRLLFEEIIKKSMENQHTNYIIVVPEQFTMSTQKELVKLHPNHAISNIDVVSFARLAYRIMEETGKANTPLIDEIGKSFILRRIVGDMKDELTVLGANMSKIGYISEIKSVISEFTQYGISLSDLESLVEEKTNYGVLKVKLEDIYKLYKAFREEIEGSCITAEEVLDILALAVPESSILKDSVVAFDGFTGFTPIQYNVISKLLEYTKMVLVTVTLDGDYKAGDKIMEHELFSLSKTTIDKLSKLADELSVKVNETIKIDTNYRLKENAELAFLEKHIFRYKKAHFRGKKVETVRIAACESPEEELGFIASEICRLVREEGLRYRDISVVTGDIGTYSRLGVKVMEKYDIPCFMDYKRDVLHNPFIECIRGLLSAIDDNLSYWSMFRFLKSGVLNLPEEELFLVENYCIERGIRGFKRWSEDWTKSKRVDISDEELIAANELRRTIMDLFTPVYQACKKKNSTVRDKVEAIYNFLCESNMQETLSDMEKLFGSGAEDGKLSQQEASLEKEYAQIYKIVVDLLDEYVELLGDEVMELSEFMQILDAGFSEARIGIIPPGLDYVTLGDLTRSRLGDIKVLFFAGVNEGIIPQVGGAGGLISDSEREMLSGSVNLSPTVREKSFIQRFYLYMTLTKASDRLYVSYSNHTADGSSARPSYLIGLLTDLFGEDIRIADSDEELKHIVTRESALEFLTYHFTDAADGRESAVWRDLYRWYMKDERYRDRVLKLKEAAEYSHDVNKDNIAEDKARELYGSLLKNSVTRLELYSRCAFSHFLKYGLGIRENNESEINAMDMGTVVHDSLEEFTKAMAKEGFNWKSLPDDVMEELTEECVREAATEVFDELIDSSARNRYMVKRISRLMKRTVWALRSQMQAGQFVQERSEMPFDYVAGDSNSELQAWVKGRIDRLDLCKKDDKVYVRIMDYKTGTKEFDLTEFYNGLSMQLIVYLDAAMRDQEKKNQGKVVIPAGVFYYIVKDPVAEGRFSTTDEAIAAQLLKGLKLTGLCNYDSEIMKLQDEAGGKTSSVLPSNKGLISEEQFNLLRGFLNKKISNLASEIISGRAEIKPCMEAKEKKACDYCEYAGICGFDSEVSGFEYKDCSGPSEDEIWIKMQSGKEVLDA